MIITQGRRKKHVLFGRFLPNVGGWGGWIPNKVQTPQNPPKSPKIAFCDPNFTFRFPKSHKNPGVGGWVNRFEKDIPKKNIFFGYLPLRRTRLKDWPRQLQTNLEQQRKINCSSRLIFQSVKHSDPIRRVMSICLEVNRLFSFQTKTIEEEEIEFSFLSANFKTRFDVTRMRERLDQSMTAPVCLQPGPTVPCQNSPTTDSDILSHIFATCPQHFMIHHWHPGMSGDGQFKSLQQVL